MSATAGPSTRRGFTLRAAATTRPPSLTPAMAVAVSRCAGAGARVLKRSLRIWANGHRQTTPSTASTTMGTTHRRTAAGRHAKSRAPTSGTIATSLREARDRQSHSGRENSACPSKCWTSVLLGGGITRGSWAQWGRELGVRPSMLEQRLRVLKWPVEKALSHNINRSSDVA
jgi:hypothetical protein